MPVGMGVPVGMSSGSSDSIVRPIVTPVGIEVPVFILVGSSCSTGRPYIVTSAGMGVPVGISAGSLCSSRGLIKTPVGMEVPIDMSVGSFPVSEDLLAHKLLWVYLLAYQFEVLIVLGDLLTHTHWYGSTC
jgi:hypothetical protein